MKNITVIGSGTMGNGIAHAFAFSGYSVVLYDIAEEAIQKGLSIINKNLDRQLSKEIITLIEKEEILGRIVGSVHLQEAVSKADLVVEAATENKELKLSIFKQLDKYTPKDSILCSNTSSIPIKEIAEATNRMARVMGMHFMNPVPVMKLVELIKSEYTSELVSNEIIEVTKSLDKIPVLVNDAPGFISNRILMPMINEAVLALEEGVGGVEEIDAIMKLGMAHPMGPLQLADLIGIDVCVYILNVLYEGFNRNEKYKPCALLKEMVEAKTLGVKSGKGFYDYSKGVKLLIVSERFL